MTPNQTVVQMLQMSSWQLEQSVCGFEADQWFHVPAEGVTSAAWIVGHATLIDRQVLEELDLPALPAMPGDWPFSRRALKTERRAMTIPEGQSWIPNAPASAYCSCLEDRLGSARPQLDLPGGDRYNPLRGGEDILCSITGRF